MQTFAVMAVVVAQLMFPPKWTPSDPGKPAVTAPAPVNPIVPLPTVGEPAPAAASLVKTIPVPSEPGAEAPADDEAPGLVFDWPDGLNVRVDTVRTKEQTGLPNAKPPVSIKAAYRMRVYPHADGLVVRSEDFELPELPPTDDPGNIEALVATLVPSLVINDEGEFQRIENTTAIKEVLTEMFEPALKNKGKLPAGVTQMMQQMTSDEFLNAIAASEWNSMVGAWMDFPITGGHFEETVEEPNPLMPDMTIPMKIELKSGASAETCARGGAQYACGVFEMTSRVDQAAFEPMMKRMFEGVKELQGVKYEQFDMLTTIRVKLENDTMLPHDYEMTKTVNMKMTMPGVAPIVMKQVERRTSKFTY